MRRDTFVRRARDGRRRTRGDGDHRPRARPRGRQRPACAPAPAWAIAPRPPPPPTCAISAARPAARIGHDSEKATRARGHTRSCAYGSALAVNLCSRRITSGNATHAWRGTGSRGRRRPAGGRGARARGVVRVQARGREASADGGAAARRPGRRG